ncbi:hypothetical protein [Haloarchaeobius sp. HRN-SO-5]|uniref:hypothetical protein n=1 Tax=Haloarchaeobius sp. HRN-SO-5 TaxID=3446118 RepID=UPI003EBBE5E8
MGLDSHEYIITADGDAILGIDRTEFLDVLQDEERLTVEDLFFDGFVTEYTDFDSFDGFVDESPWTIESASDFEDVPRDALDEYVAENTEFENWKWMVRAASEEYVQRKTSY